MLYDIHAPIPNWHRNIKEAGSQDIKVYSWKHEPIQKSICKTKLTEWALWKHSTLNIVEQSQIGSFELHTWVENKNENTTTSRNQIRTLSVLSVCLFLLHADLYLERRLSTTSTCLECPGYTN